MLTLNQIKERLVQYFTDHAGVNHVAYADDFGLNGLRDLTYPVVGIEFVDASISDRLLNYNFKVTIADVVSEDRPELQDEIHSDTLQIAEDFFSFLQYQEGWVFNRSSQIQKFWDDTGDRSCGVSFNVTLSVVRSQNECVVPTNVALPIDGLLQSQGTLNVFKGKLVDFFEAHGQIHQVVYGDDFEFNDERSLTYPVVNVEFLDATMGGKLTNYNFKVVIGDLVNGSMDEVWSDTIQIAEDFFAFLGLVQGWVFNKSVSIQKFEEDGGDRVAGIVFRVSLGVVRKQNDCLWPKRIPTPTPSVTPSNTATPSPTPSVTPSRSFTATPTATATLTPTSSPTPGITATRTPTATPTNTVTPSASVTRTPTASPTPGVSVTPSASMTATPTLTPTSSVTPTASATPGASLTPTSSVTPTKTPTSTPTPSAYPFNTIYPNKGGDNGVIITSGIQPGDTVVIRSSQNPWSYFFMGGICGTAENPITIINQGPVEMTAGITLENCCYVNVIGSGDTGTYYGFKIQHVFGQSSASAINVKGLSHHIRISRIHVDGAGYILWAKNEASEYLCDTSYYWPSRMHHLEFDHLKGTNIWQDGFYIGSSDPYGKSREVTCGGITTKPRPTGLSDVWIHDCFMDYIGRSGIQWGGVDQGDNRIYNNEIYRCGFELNDQQGCGIAFGSASNGGKIYGNIIRNSFKNSIFSYHYGMLEIYDNILDYAGFIEDGQLPYGMSAIFFNTYDGDLDPDTTRFIIRNNTITNPSDAYPIAFFDQKLHYGTGNTICGNTFDGAALTNANVYVQPGAVVSWSSDCSGFPAGSPLPTTTPTRTPTQTPTPSVTASVTATATLTPTSTVTATASSTPGSSATGTPTPTPTPTVTPSNTATPTVTPSVTATETPTSTPTPTVTPSLTASVTPTNTVTPSVTASVSMTPTASLTPTGTPTPTNTPTPSVTASNTVTPTNTPTASVTATRTVTPTNTVTPTSSATASATPTRTPTPTATPSSVDGSSYLLINASDIMSINGTDNFIL